MPGTCGWWARFGCGFFFSSRRRHTRCSRDWSSDVCSSDLRENRGRGPTIAGSRKPRNKDDRRSWRRAIGKGDEYAANLQTLLRDRKSTRLNSSHGYISYAVFCLKKKKKKIEST